MGRNRGLVLYKPRTVDGPISHSSSHTLEPQAYGLSDVLKFDGKRTAFRNCRVKLQPVYAGRGCFEDIARG